MRIFVICGPCRKGKKGTKMAEKRCLVFVAESDQFREAEYNEVIDAVKTYNKEMKEGDITISWDVYTGERY